MYVITSGKVLLTLGALLLALALSSCGPIPTTSIIVKQGYDYYQIHPEVVDASGHVKTEKSSVPTTSRDTHVNASGDQLLVSSTSFPDCSAQYPVVTFVSANGAKTVLPEACSPQFSPDGKYFAYIGQDANGEGFVRIRKTDTPGNDIGNQHMSVNTDIGNIQFVWSPDGQQIVALASGDNGKLFIYPALSQDAAKEIDFQALGNDHAPLDLVDWIKPKQ